MKKVNNIADDIVSTYDEGFNDGVKSLLSKLKESNLGWYDWEEKATVFTEEDIETIANQLIEKGR